MLRSILIKFISLYQRTLSPDHGWFKHPIGHCRYYPTCSEYAKQAIKKHGAIKGVFLAIYRIIRCNPWSKGGVDEV
jgi:putative membrane protein insertion efficiency factor